MMYVTVFLAFFLVTIDLVAHLGVGYLLGTGLNAVGLLSQGTLWWCSITIVTTIALILDRGFRRWVGANSALATAIASAFTSACAYAHWYETSSTVALWIGRITAIIAIILFIRYSCRWGNWCGKIGPKWRNKGWPALKKGWAKVWALCCDFGTWVETKALPWLYDVGAYWKPAFVKNFWRILFFVTAGVAYFGLYQEQLDWGKQSRWFWGAVTLAVIFALAGWEALRKLLGKFLGTCWSIFQEKSEECWEKFKTDTSDWGKALTGAVAVLGLAIVTSLLQEVFQRNTGWLFRWLHINMYAHERVTWSGAALVAGVFTTAVIFFILVLPYWWKSDKKKSTKLSKEEERAKKKKDKAIEKAIRDEGGEKAVLAFRKANKA